MMTARTGWPVFSLPLCGLPTLPVPEPAAPRRVTLISRRGGYALHLTTPSSFRDSPVGPPSLAETTSRNTGAAWSQSRRRTELGAHPSLPLVTVLFLVCVPRWRLHCTFQFPKPTNSLHGMLLSLNESCRACPVSALRGGDRGGGYWGSSNSLGAAQNAAAQSTYSWCGRPGSSFS